MIEGQPEPVPYCPMPEKPVPAVHPPWFDGSIPEMYTGPPVRESALIRRGAASDAPPVARSDGVLLYLRHVTPKSADTASAGVVVLPSAVPTMCTVRSTLTIIECGVMGTHERYAHDPLFTMKG